MSTSISQIVLYAFPAVLAITLHEAAHGLVARWRGDDTAWKLGRVTANPLKHIDLIGTVVIPLVLLVINAPFLFGWAKPVPVQVQNLHNPKQDMIWVAAAGPAANFLMMAFWAVLYHVATPLLGNYYDEPIRQMALIGVIFNLSLGVFNLIPIPPLDGGRILTGLLPSPLDATLARVEPFGFFILVLLLSTHSLDSILNPVRLFLLQLLGLM